MIVLMLYFACCHVTARPGGGYTGEGIGKAHFMSGSGRGGTIPGGTGDGRNTLYPFRKEKTIMKYSVIKKETLKKDFMEKNFCFFSCRCFQGNQPNKK